MIKTCFLSALAFYCFSAAFAQVPGRFSVVIEEIMPDPSPQVSLPNSEWIELKNTSGFPINLSGWRIGDASGLSGPMPSFVLQPDSFVVVSSTGSVAALSIFGKTIAVSNFPSLDNAGDLIYLQSAQGAIIHAVEYSLSWYRNAIKAEGGWSLEMIDVANPCSGWDNWKASTDLSGGTPGRMNTANGFNKDQLPPRLLRTYSIDSVTIIALFNEPLDSSSASNPLLYTISGSGVLFASAQAPAFNSVKIRLAAPMQKRTIYELRVNDVDDCKGNTIGIYNTARVGLPEDALATDLVINEILFNPRPNAFDYIEVYNRSNKIFDAGKLLIANRSSSGAISGFKNFADQPFLVFPGHYLVLTPDPASLQREYAVPNPDHILTVALPAYPDDSGTVVVANYQGVVIDEVTYSEKWHFRLINNYEGVALERIDAEAPSQYSGNWHSAATTAGYGTPTGKNSQSKLPGVSEAALEVMPKIFSPDNDAVDDIAKIEYKLKETGYLANVTIFDTRGRAIRYLVRNELLGYKGGWNWDGLDEKKNRLPAGPYIVYAELFDLKGKKEVFKMVLVLARRL